MRGQYWLDAARGTVRLWKKGLPSFFPVLFLCRLAAFGIVLPAFEFTLKQALRLAGYSYLTPQNVGAFLLRPSAWLLVAGWIVILSVLCMAEQLGAGYFYHLKEQKMEFRFTDLLHFGAYALRSLPRRRCARVFGYALLQRIPNDLAMFGFVLLRFRIPHYIWDYIRESNKAAILAGVLAAALIVLAFRRYFIVPYFLIEGCDGKEAGRRAGLLLRRNRVRTLVLYAGTTVLVTVGTILMYLIIMVALVALMKLFMRDQLVLAKFLAMYDDIHLVLAFVIGTVSAYLYLGLQTHLYYQYKEERDELTSREEAYGYVEKTRLRRYVLLARILAACVLLTSVVSAYSIFRNGTFQSGTLLPVTTITAHRGQSVQAPENTLPALELAIGEAADYAEIDVRQTADGAVVLMHDLSLKRTCGVSRPISEVSYQELQELDAGAWFSPDYRGTRVPTLREAMELCKGAINLNIELKVHGDAEELAEKVVALIKEYDFENQCILSSTNYEVLTRVKEYNPQLRTGYIMSMVYGNYYDKEGIDFFSIKSGFVTQSTVDKLHGAGKEVHVWTVNSKAELQRMKNIGVDSIITDDAILARRVLFSDLDGTFFGILQTILNS